MSTTHPTHGLTREYLETTPDDGQRYELIDGELVVSPAPSIRHQEVAGSVYRLLHAAAPRGWFVGFAPLAVGLAEDTELQPDVLVARRSDFTEKDLPQAPALAVEVLSPSSRRNDLVRKKERLERAGCPSYWVVEPQELRLTAWELVDGRFVQVVDVGPGETWVAARPFNVEVTPGALVE